MIGALWGGMLDVLLPRHCVVSGRPLAPDETACVAPEILRQAVLTAGDYCSRCGARQGEGVGVVERCGRCEEFKEGFSCNEICAVGDYEGVLRELCIALKFHGERRVADVLAPYIVQQTFDRGFATRIDAIVPMPLHALRQWQRGYNQAELLAAPLAKAIAKPLWLDALKRRRGTKKQSELSAAQRKANVEGAFEVRPRAVKTLEGKTILLVDDVMTTGATLREAALSLKRAGAKAVLGAVVARSTVGADGV
jgi:ComF family protein